MADEAAAELIHPVRAAVHAVRVDEDGVGRNRAIPETLVAELDGVVVARRVAARRVGQRDGERRRDADLHVAARARVVERGDVPGRLATGAGPVCVRAPARHPVLDVEVDGVHPRPRRRDDGVVQHACDAEVALERVQRRRVVPAGVEAHHVVAVLVVRHRRRERARVVPAEAVPRLVGGGPGVPLRRQDDEPELVGLPVDGDVPRADVRGPEVAAVDHVDRGADVVRIRRIEVLVPARDRPVGSRAGRRDEHLLEVVRRPVVHGDGKGRAREPRRGSDVQRRRAGAQRVVGGRRRRGARCAVVVEDRDDAVVLREVVPDVRVTGDGVAARADLVEAVERSPLVARHPERVPLRRDFRPGHVDVAVGHVVPVVRDVDRARAGSCEHLREVRRRVRARLAAQIRELAEHHDPRMRPVRERWRGRRASDGG